MRTRVLSLLLSCWHIHNLKHRIPTVLAEETKETKETSRKLERKPEVKNAIVELTKVENACISMNRLIHA